MSLISLNELKSLSEKQEAWCVSIYMPTQRIPQDPQHDSLVLKNLLDDAEKQLLERGQRVPQVKEILEPAIPLLTDSMFWKHQADGLAIFLSPGEFKAFHLPLKTEKMVMTAYRYYLKPLFPLLSGDGQFYVLALSQEQVRLLQCSRDSAEEVELHGIPTSMSAVMKDTVFEKQLQFHTRSSAPGARGKRHAIFYGHGAEASDSKSQLLRYCQQIEEGITPLLKSQQAPLVLAGLEYLLSIYRGINSYQALLDHGIESNVDRLSAEELHRRAWPLVEPTFTSAQKVALEEYQRLFQSGDERASQQIVEIVPASYHSRVKTLFVALDIQEWGIYDPQTDQVKIDSKPTQKNQDLLDYAAIQTLLNGGIIYALDKEKMPNHANIAAVFRY